MGDPGWLEVLSRALARGEVPSRRRLFKLLGALAAAAAIGRAPRAAAAATTAKKSKRRAACTPGIVQSATLVDAPSIGAGLRLGGFSGLASLDPSRGLFLSVTDRGPNSVVVAGKTTRVTFPVPSFTPSILQLALDRDQLRIVERQPLRLRPGFVDPISGTREISGLSNSDRDEPPFDRGGRAPLPLDPNGIDSESLALGPDGTLWVGDEYGPSILHLARDGTILLRLVPNGLVIDAPGENVRDILPKELARRKINRGFEGLGLSPDGRILFAILQSPLLNPDQATGEASRNIRLITLDVSDGDQPRLQGVFVYLAEAGTDVGSSQDDLRIGDLAAIDGARALVVERDSTIGGPHKKVYRIDLSGATNLLDRGLIDGKTVEQLSPADLQAAGIKPVAKSLAADLAAFGYQPEKIEGLAIVDDRTIAVVNDDDFGFIGFDDNDQPIPNGVETRLVIVCLPQPLS